jgi:hypothetical protein
VDFLASRRGENLPISRLSPYDQRAMTRKEAIRRLEYLALQAGHKRKHYIKRALVEFLENRESLLLGARRTTADGTRPSFEAGSYRPNRYPN